MHTNPILLSFCSLLYYKNLREHIAEYKLERRRVEKILNLNDEFSFRIKKFTGRSQATSAEKLGNKRYKKRIVNKWHVVLTLQMNKSLIKYRKHNLIKKKTEEKLSIIQKLKSCCSRSDQKNN